MSSTKDRTSSTLIRTALRASLLGAGAQRLGPGTAASLTPCPRPCSPCILSSEGSSGDPNPRPTAGNQAPRAWVAGETHSNSPFVGPSLSTCRPRTGPRGTELGAQRRHLSRQALHRKQQAQSLQRTALPGTHLVLLSENRYFQESAKKTLTLGVLEAVQGADTGSGSKAQEASRGSLPEESLHQ